jgi:hypothetical protein
MIVFVAITLKKDRGERKRKEQNPMSLELLAYIFFSIFCHFAIISSH